MAETILDVKNAVLFRELLGQIRAASFGGNLSAMARALELTPAYVSDVLADKRGAGMKIIRAVSRFTGHSLEDLIDGIALTPDPYPARAQALFCVRNALLAVRRAEHPGAEKRSVEWWLLRLRDEEAKTLAAFDGASSPTIDDSPPESAVHRKFAVGEDG